MEYRALFHSAPTVPRRVPVYFDAADDDAARAYVRSAWPHRDDDYAVLVVQGARPVEREATDTPVS